MKFVAIRSVAPKSDIGLVMLSCLGLHSHLIGLSACRFIMPRLFDFILSIKKRGGCLVFSFKQLLTKLF
jgi:hypothetical protein